ncbi:MAG: NapC/NirT family cytochrome c [Deltaproteobacteria bacterium]|nr:NapC/NirT family cytochrome c [Deltaproteobacteria bacterium]
MTFAAGPYVIVGLMALNIVLLAVLLAQREWFMQRLGKVLLLLGALALPALVLSAAVHINMENSKEVSFCLSCHEMEAYGESLEEDDDERIPTIHYQNNWVHKEKACYECHTDYTLYGPIKAKIQGLLHMNVHYFKGAPKKIEIYQPYNNRECLRCHEGAKKFEETEYHQQDPKMRVRLKTNKQSCMDKGCHDVIHEVYSDDE